MYTNGSPTLRRQLKGTSQKAAAVLVPICLHEACRASHLAALELAGQWGGHVTLLNVSSHCAAIKAEVHGFDAIGLLHSALDMPAGAAATRFEQQLELQRLEQDAVRRMKALAKSVLEGCDSVDYVWRTGDPVSEIVALAEQLNVDAIILGARERSFRWSVRGRTVHKILEAAARQVIVAYPSGRSSVKIPTLTSVAS
jgi:nucleotide-binding universal stress UspA family protein